MTSVYFDTLFFLCNSFLNFPKEVDGRGYHQYPQQGIEKSGTITADIPHDGLHVLSLEEPVPIKQGGEDGDQAHHHKDSLYDIMHYHTFSPCFPDEQNEFRLPLLQ